MIQSRFFILGFFVVVVIVVALTEPRAHTQIELGWPANELPGIHPSPPPARRLQTLFLMKVLQI